MWRQLLRVSPAAAQISSPSTGSAAETGAAPTRIRDNVGIPIELALAAVDGRLRHEGIRNEVSIVAAGSIRSSSDVVKAIALGADAVYLGTAALLALAATYAGAAKAASAIGESPLRSRSW